MARILLLDDELHALQAMALHLRKQGYEVVTGRDGQVGLDQLATGSFDLVVTDLRMPRLSGMELLKTVRDRGLTVPFIVLTAYATIESAVEAMRLGAADYIGKPPQLDEITFKVRNVLNQHALLEENRRLRDSLSELHGYEGIIGRSRLMREMQGQLRIFARDPHITVLVTGESGTGKELIVRTLHYNSPRASGPLLAINCGALPETLLESELFGHQRGAFTGAFEAKKGLIEAAHRGTLFLDEIGDMPMSMQVKLLRVLEEREIRRVGGTKTIPVDVRFVASSNQDLETLVANKTFRQDLYFRLAVATLPLPPLRKRQGDVPLLTERFLTRFNRDKGKSVRIGTDAMELLDRHTWPGNVRELEHLIELLVVTSQSQNIGARALPQRFHQNRDPHPGGSPEEEAPNLAAATRRLVVDFERRFILRHLERNHWNVTRTARAIGISRAALYLKIKDYALSASHPPKTANLKATDYAD